MPVITFGRFADMIKTLPANKKCCVMSRGLSNNAMDGRVEYKICRTRESMARQVRKSHQKPIDSTTWKALVKLADWEGYR